MKCCNILIFVYYLISSFLVIVNSELYTAVVDLQNLLYTEGEIVKTLEKYLEKEEQRLEKVRWYVLDFIFFGGDEVLSLIKIYLIIFVF